MVEAGHVTQSSPLVGQGGSSGLVVTPVLVILVAMVAGLALVAVCIILVMRGEDTQVDSEEKHDHTLYLQ